MIMLESVVLSSSSHMKLEVNDVGSGQWVGFLVSASRSRLLTLHPTWLTKDCRSSVR